MAVHLLPFWTRMDEELSLERHVGAGSGFKGLWHPVNKLAGRFCLEGFMNQTPFASFWLAAGESGFAAKSDWQEWADGQIFIEPNPPVWLIDLSLTKDVDGLWKVLSPVVDAEVHAGSDRRSIDDAVLGYLWLRYNRGNIDLQTCLNLAGRHADSSDSSIDCENIYSLLNQLEDPSADKSAVQQEAKTLFEPFVLLAQRQWAALQDQR